MALLEKLGVSGKENTPYDDVEHFGSGKQETLRCPLASVLVKMTTTLRHPSSDSSLCPPHGPLFTLQKPTLEDAVLSRDPVGPHSFDCLQDQYSPVFRATGRHSDELGPSQQQSQPGWNTDSRGVRRPKQRWGQHEGPGLRLLCPQQAGCCPPVRSLTVARRSRRLQASQQHCRQTDGRRDER